MLEPLSAIRSFHRHPSRQEAGGIFISARLGCVFPPQANAKAPARTLVCHKKEKQRGQVQSCTSPALRMMLQNSSTLIATSFAKPQTNQCPASKHANTVNFQHIECFQFFLLAQLQYIGSQTRRHLTSRRVTPQPFQLRN